MILAMPIRQHGNDRVVINTAVRISPNSGPSHDFATETPLE
jgi:hypothetical protein